MKKKTDYQIALESVKKIQEVFLGQEVKTELGNGIVVKLEMNYNGLYLSPLNSLAVVWFGTGEYNGWVTHSFRVCDLKINHRKIKLNKLSLINK